MEIDWEKVRPVEDNFEEHFSTSFVRPLTKKDCERGYHCYRAVGEDDTRVYEKCRTCGKLYIIHKLAEKSRSERDKYALAHKLDFLQPYGKTEKDFIDFYGKPDRHFNNG